LAIELKLQPLVLQGFARPFEFDCHGFTHTGGEYRMEEPENLTENERLLLLAAAVHDLGPDTDISGANTARIVNQVLRWRGLSAEQVRDGWRTRECDPLHQEVYDTLIRMTQMQHQAGGWRAPERPGAPLFEGAGNWGVPGDPSQPACWPQYNSCRLTGAGERLAQKLLTRYPEYSGKSF
jgi:hypothetical protein